MVGQGMKSDNKTRKKAVPTQPGRNGGTLLAGSHGGETGRPKGSLNRSTIVSRFLDAMSKVKNPITGEMENLSQEEIMTLSMIYAATKKLDVRAYNSLLDNKYGKQKENVQVDGSIILEYVRPNKPKED